VEVVAMVSSSQQQHASPHDVVMDGEESADPDEVAMEGEPHLPAAERGRRSLAEQGRFYLRLSGMAVGIARAACCVRGQLALAAASDSRH
jgi:hypothetical protein